MSPDAYAVVGNPVEHSQSPFIHAAFARQAGHSITYARVLAPLDGFADTMREFAASGARGCNVTVPFKFEAHDLCSQLTARAALAGAVNTVSFDASGWRGDNTDGVGLARDITANAGVAIRGTRILMLGAGGAAAGALGALLGEKPAAVVVANRSADKARALVERHAANARELGVTLTASALDECPQGFDVVVNATAASLAGAELNLDARVLRAGALAVDMMYGAAARPFLEWARDCGALARDGLGMLVEQAAESFFVWRGVRVSTGPVLAELRERIDHRLSAK
jgi:shikimate dehydrogenase